MDMSDSDIGGYSEARIAHVAESGTEPAHAHFSGSISKQLPLKDLKVERSGYAAWRTRDRPSTLFGRTLWDVDVYEYLALRVKSDGRKYKVNIQTESIEYTDLHQHRLYSKRPGSWETVLIKWSDFVRTNHGYIVEPQSEMLKEKVRTIGVGLTDGQPGTFTFRISKIWATNGLTDDEREVSGQNEQELLPKYMKDKADSAKEQQVNQM